MRVFAIICAVFFAVSATLAQDNRGIDDGTSLGDVTKDAAGPSHGQHASDPTGDGLGVNDTEHKDAREGLANLGATKGDLSTTIDIIDGD